MQTCNTSTGPKWSLGAEGSIRSGGKCLAPVGSATVNATRLTLATCGSGTDQRWSFTS
ncbi:RICIN domain-containing protein [Streptomyces sp. NBC_00347]|uniref:RICIN domain-containing protein n=1 Tax=Streptomyces sp. NBC_00347 TaxID=2975721 RepID=UPI00338FF88D